MKAKELIEKYKNGQRDFRGVCLSGENLAWATLTQIDLRASNLQEANLSGANLCGANLSEKTNLAFANFSRADLSGADLRDANLIGASLDSATLDGVLHNSITQFPQGFDPSQIKPSGIINEYLQTVAVQSGETTQQRVVLSQNAIQEPKGRLDPKSKRYGCLLNWQNPSDPFWHYGIGLSDQYVFDTGKGLQPFEKKDAKIVEGIERIVFSPQQTIDRLIHARAVFGDWAYSGLGWNCEHLARLIATDEPKSYQCQWTWWLSDLMPNGEHKTARQVFREYLAQNAPELNR
jgi:hypothetical protein